jgi:hypothetical protein
MIFLILINQKKNIIISVRLYVTECWAVEKQQIHEVIIANDKIKIDEGE